ncbi:hypothetical protein ACVILI_006663 [Mesorhizobium sp. USDA 4775]
MVIYIDHDLDARQMCWQRISVRAAFGDLRLSNSGSGLLVVLQTGSFDLLERFMF